MLPVPVSKSISAFLNTRSGKPVTITASVALGGGCINEAAKVLTNAGDYFIKYNRADAFPRMFKHEASGLQLLRETEVIRTPYVIYQDDADTYSFLLLEFISSKNRATDFWNKFGRALAALHKHTNSYFGLDHDNYIGSLIQRNHAHQDWQGFFVNERLEPMVKQARDKGEISSQLVSQFEIIYQKLPDYVPVEKPSLLHGDLWSGNYLIDDKGNPCLIDPAVYYGHREMDIAMTRLFSGFPPEFYESYCNFYALEPGWQERLDLMNLYPLMVHVNLFRGSYISEVKQILNRFT